MRLGRDPKLTRQFTSTFKNKFFADQALSAFLDPDDQLAFWRGEAFVSASGRAVRHCFEHFSHVTLSLYAALDTRTGDVMGKTTARHTSAEFVDFSGKIIASQLRVRVRRDFLVFVHMESPSGLRDD